MQSSKPATQKESKPMIELGTTEIERRDEQRPTSTPNGTPRKSFRQSADGASVIARRHAPKPRLDVRFYEAS